MRVSMCAERDDLLSPSSADDDSSTLSSSTVEMTASSLTASMMMTETSKHSRWKTIDEKSIHAGEIRLFLFFSFTSIE